MFLFSFFSVLIHAACRIFFLSPFPPLYSHWLPPNHFWNRSVISSDLFLWGFLVKGFTGRRECRAAIYHHSALTDLMYSHVLKIQAIRWTEKYQGIRMACSLTNLCAVESWLRRWMNGACLVRGTVLGIPRGSHCTCCCVKTLYEILHPVQRKLAHCSQCESSVYRIEQRKC